MKLLKKMALATAIGVASVGAHASTMVFDFGGSVDLSFDDSHSEQIVSDYSDLFQSEADFSSFYGTIILPDYEQYSVGTHTIDLNSEGLELSIVSGLLGEIEGSRTNVTAPNSDYVEGVENCARNRANWTNGGCDFDGDGTFETEMNNNPETITVARTWRPSDTQHGDSGSLTLVDGKITSFDWNAGYANEGIIGTYNDRLFGRQGWQTELGSISISVEGATAQYSPGSVYNEAGDIIYWGDTFFSSNNAGVASVSMVPESSTYAMLFAGLGLLGAITRRRRRVAAK